MNQKNIITERIIQLNELPPEGRQFNYTQESGELNDSLKDLLGTRAYKAQLNLLPAGNVFQISGSIETTLPLLCSRCAVDFNYQLCEKFSEILMIVPPMSRTEKSSHSNHSSEQSSNGPFCNYLETEQFDAGEFLHEIIALAEPSHPLGKPNCDKSCENYQEAISQGWIQEEFPDTSKSPFAALAALKDSAKLQN